MSNIQKIDKNGLFENIKDLLVEARKFVVRNINQTMVYTYFEIGRMIVEDEQKGERRAEYGKQVLIDLSKRLTEEFGRGFSVENLDRMRYFYQTYSISSTVLTKSASIPQALSDELQCTENQHIGISATLPRKSLPIPNFRLSWSHYLKLMRIDDIAERQFYEIEAANNNWSLRELQRQYDSALYQRLALSKDKQGILELSRKGQIIEKPEDAIKDPFIVEFTGLPENSRYSESDLEQKLIDKLEHFLLELGKGFTFVGRQVRFTFDEKHFRVDLVFYNRILQSFVLVDLKIGDLTHQDIGQMQMYVNYYDRFVRLEHENKTIGIILCRDKNETLVKITLPEDNEQIFASRYKTVLPSKEELKKLIESKE
ncbi:MAG: PDDEXK nuclease domain-containing protein [Bacteroidales bacterium]|nr:PDDEXK nuclease domain-containing protein [Bacteroidales bacterium]